MIARLDADTQADPGWAQAIINHFQQHPGTDAADGHIRHFDMPDYRWPPLRFQPAPTEPTRSTVIVGANMAIRRTSWEAVRDHTRTEGRIWEDADLAFSLMETGHTITAVPGMTAAGSGRTLLKGPIAYGHYCASLMRTVIGRKRYALIPGAALHWAYSMLTYLLKYFPARRYDPATGTSSWGHFWKTVRSR